MLEQTILINNKPRSYMIEAKDIIIKCDSTLDVVQENKIKVENIANYQWDSTWLYGNLVDYHKYLKFIAYPLKSTTCGVRVMHNQTKIKPLLKSSSNFIYDIAFSNVCISKKSAPEPDIIAYEYNSCKLAYIDSNALVYVYEIQVSLNNSNNSIVEDENLYKCVSLFNFVPYANPNNEKCPPALRIKWHGSNISELSGKPCEYLLVIKENLLTVFNIQALLAKNDSGSNKLQVYGCLEDNDSPDIYNFALDQSKEINDAILFSKNFYLALALKDGTLSFYEGLFAKSPKCIKQWTPHSGSPLSSVRVMEQPLSQYHFLITMAMRNTEIKIWNFEKDQCLQSLKFVGHCSDPLVGSGPIGLQLKCRFDQSSRCLVMSDINGKAIYVLTLAQVGSGHSGDSTSYGLEGSPRFVAIALKLTAQPLISFAVEEISFLGSVPNICGPNPERNNDDLFASIFHPGSARPAVITDDGPDSRGESPVVGDSAKDAIINSYNMKLISLHPKCLQKLEMQFKVAHTPDQVIYGGGSGPVQSVVLRPNAPKSRDQDDTEGGKECGSVEKNHFTRHLNDNFFEFRTTDLKESLDILDSGDVLYTKEGADPIPHSTVDGVESAEPDVSAGNIFQTLCQKLRPAEKEVKGKIVSGDSFEAEDTLPVREPKSNVATTSSPGLYQDLLSYILSKTDPKDIETPKEKTHSSVATPFNINDLLSTHPTVQDPALSDSKKTSAQVPPDVTTLSSSIGLKVSTVSATSPAPTPISSNTTTSVYPLSLDALFAKKDKIFSNAPAAKNSSQEILAHGAVQRQNSSVYNIPLADSFKDSTAAAPGRSQNSTYSDSKGIEEKYDQSQTTKNSKIRCISETEHHPNNRASDLYNKDKREKSKVFPEYSTPNQRAAPTTEDPKNLRNSNNNNIPRNHHHSGNASPNLHHSKNSPLAPPPLPHLNNAYRDFNAGSYRKNGQAAYPPKQMTSNSNSNINMAKGGSGVSKVASPSQRQSPPNAQAVDNGSAGGTICNYNHDGHYKKNADAINKMSQKLDSTMELLKKLAENQVRLEQKLAGFIDSNKSKPVAPPQTSSNSTETPSSPYPDLAKNLEIILNKPTLWNGLNHRLEKTLQYVFNSHVIPEIFKSFNHLEQKFGGTIAISNKLQQDTITKALNQTAQTISSHFKTNAGMDASLEKKILLTLEESCKAQMSSATLGKVVTECFKTTYQSSVLPKLEALLVEIFSQFEATFARGMTQFCSSVDGTNAETGMRFKALVRDLDRSIAKMADVLKSGGTAQESRDTTSRDSLVGVVRVTVEEIGRKMVGQFDELIQQQQQQALQLGTVRERDVEQKILTNATEHKAMTQIFSEILRIALTQLLVKFQDILRKELSASRTKERSAIKESLEGIIKESLVFTQTNASHVQDSSTNSRKIPHDHPCHKAIPSPPILTMADLNRLVDEGKIVEAFMEAISYHLCPIGKDEPSFLARLCKRLDPIDLFESKRLSQQMTLGIVEKIGEELSVSDFSEMEVKCSFLEEGLMALDEKDNSIPQAKLNYTLSRVSQTLKKCLKNPKLQSTFVRKIRKMDMLVDRLLI